MTDDKAYIKITDTEDEDFVPSDDEILLDSYVDVEYTTPYTDNYDDIFDVGGVIETVGIFDDR